MEPPTSDPTPKTEAAEEMAAASPPEEPPQMRPVWYGFLVRPYTLLYVSHHMHSSGTFVTPETGEGCIHERGGILEFVLQKAK